MVLFILEKNIDSDYFIKMCLKQYLNMANNLNLDVDLELLNDKNLVEKIHINRDKKPYFTVDNKPINIYFNLSHTKGAMVLLMDTNEVGVDIEKIKDRDYKAIAKRENFEVSSLVDFYKMWTKCEAFVKYYGDSFANIKNNKDFDLSTVKTIDVLDGYVISIKPYDNLLISILT